MQCKLFYMFKIMLIIYKKKKRNINLLIEMKRINYKFFF